MLSVFSSSKSARLFGVALLAGAISLLTCGPARSQGVSVSADPADPSAAVPATLYRSPFAGYRVQAAPPVAPWRESNDRVLQRGGWRAYAKQAASADATAPATPATPTTPGALAAPNQPTALPAPPVPADHSGHPMK